MNISSQRQNEIIGIMMDDIAMEYIALEFPLLILRKIDKTENGHTLIKFVLDHGVENYETRKTN
jgi:hypothetical protein